MAAKHAILKAKVENQIIELMLKSDVTNVYLEDGTTTLASKLAEMVTAIDSKTTADAVATQISTAIDALIGGAPGTYDTLKEIADYLSTHQNEYTALVQTVGSKASQEALNAVIERVSALETKMATIEQGAQVNKIEKIFVNGAEQEISEKGVSISIPTGALASKDEVTEDLVADALMEKINSSAEGNHAHSNKEVLDGITAEKVADWDDAVSKEHEHTNKAELDKIADGDKAKWDEAYGKMHEHENKAVIDGITADLVSAWNGKAKVYTQSAQPTDLAEGDLFIQLVD